MIRIPRFGVIPLTALISLQAAESGRPLGTPKFQPAVRLHDGRGPSMVANGKSFALLYSRPSTSGKGSDLFFQPSLDAKAAMRVNDVASEVRDGGENGPILLKSPSAREFYAIWNASDSRHPLANKLRFSKWSAGTGQWTKAVTINDDVPPSTHTFQGAGISPDGWVHVAWLDRRELPPPTGPADYPGGGLRTSYKLLDDTAVLYTASWKGGERFGKNVRVASNVCPCCRVAVGFAKGRVLLAWRSVDQNNIRDIALATSSDGGATWTAPRIAIRDEWKINACPHVGPTLATANDTVYLGWATRGKRDSGVFVAASKDGGDTFGGVVKLSSGLATATHPYIAASDSHAITVFQGAEKASAAEAGHSEHSAHRSPSSHAPVAPAAAYVAALRSDGSLSRLVQLPVRAVNYPSVAINAADEIAVAWTQMEGGRSTAWIALGKTQ